MFRKILVGVDGSDIGYKALKTAISLAKPLGASLDILYVLPKRMQPILSERAVMAEFGGDENSPPPALKGMDDEVLNKAEEIATDLGMKASCHSFIGSPAEIITTFADENNNDLIVVASGKGPADRFVLGSVSDAIVRESGKPVLVIKPDES